MRKHSYNKGQSAIEYLMTYGWMLLVVAIAGGAIFSVVSAQAIESVSGFTGGDMEVSDFGIDAEDNRLHMVVRNTAANSIKINYVNVSDGEEYSKIVSGPIIDVTDIQMVSVWNVGEADETNSLEVTINYDQGDLEDLEVRGAITGTLDVVDYIEVHHPINEPQSSEPEDLNEVLEGMSGEGSEESPYIITNDHELQAIEADTGAYYRLGGSIDLSGTTAWDNGNGFDSISGFSGRLDGQGYEIQDLLINRRGSTNTGLFSSLDSDGEIIDVGLLNAEVTGGARTGSLVGTSSGTINRSYVTGQVVADQGLRTRSGAFVGRARGDAVIANSYSMADITEESSSSIERIGGLVGETRDNTRIINSYATGDVNAEEAFRVGGLIGNARGNTETVSSYATGRVSGESSVGGLIGDNRGTVENSYWDIEATGLEFSDGGEGLFSDQMQGEDAVENMDDFEFGVNWITSAGYPALWWENRVN